MQSVMKSKKSPPPPAREAGPRLIGYARVSTLEQRLDLQLDALKAAGVHVDDIYKDQVSGSRVTRRGLTNAMRALAPGDTLVVWKLDRFGRSVSDLLKRLEEFDKIGVGFKSLTEGFDTTTAMGKLVLHMTAAFAQFERDLARERTIAGMKAAKERGAPMGRRPRLKPKQKDEIEKLLLTTDMPLKDIAKRFKVSIGTIYNAFPGGRTGLLQ